MNVLGAHPSGEISQFGKKVVEKVAVVGSEEVCGCFDFGLEFKLVKD